ncbi:arrestin domain-containing protein [Colletotrichum karsti]|uniref:Arrestin domain-containing protein n=1 Tax=Colletotrichum karsti TaxID=1095194 RepID=A0A9P6ICX2_9PEZI|nr:arrestin domain-containing protein [Colletotrichum karsti]KAF9880325.1 arrestin domain-containing protein [Colletotrichum karsti]
MSEKTARLPSSADTFRCAHPISSLFLPIFGHDSWPGVPKMGFNININHHYTSKVYTTRSTISGNVSVCPERDISFRCVQIALIGTYHARIDMLPVPRIIDNDFLTLDMPINEELYPSDRIFRAGKTYQIPFHFTLPYALSKDACDKLSESGHIQELHMRLPPTMGQWERDDMSPVMARVEYNVVARLLKRNTSELGQTIEASQPIRVMPEFSEDPPLGITEQDTRYSLSKTRFIRKSLLSTQKDQVTLTTAQPGAVHLSTQGQAFADSPATVMLHLHYKSASSFSSPPEVNVTQVKLETITWFSGTPMKTLPELGEARDSSGTRHELKYVASVKLPPTQLQDIAWHQESNTTGRDSSAWTAAIGVPIHLPTAHKMFLPTFHNCFLARTYVLHLSVGIAGAKTTLSVPLQVATEAIENQTPKSVGDELPNFHAAMAWG